MSPEYNVSCKFTGNDGENEIKLDFTYEAFTPQDNADLIDSLYHFIKVFKRL